MAHVRLTLVASNEPEVDGLQVGDLAIQAGKPITVSVTNADKLAKTFPNATFKREEVEGATPSTKKGAPADADDTSDAETPKAAAKKSGTDVPDNTPDTSDTPKTADTASTGKTRGSNA